MGALQVGQPCPWVHPRESQLLHLNFLTFARLLIHGSQGMNGLSAQKIPNKLALRVSTTGSIFMDSVKVPHDALMPDAIGLGAAFSCLNSARSVLSPYLSLLSESYVIFLPAGSASRGASWAPLRIASIPPAHTPSTDTNFPGHSPRSNLCNRS